MTMVPTPGKKIYVHIDEVDDRPTCDRCHRAKRLKILEMTLWFDGHSWGRTIRASLCVDCRPEIKLQMEQLEVVDA